MGSRDGRVLGLRCIEKSGLQSGVLKQSVEVGGVLLFEGLG